MRQLLNKKIKVGLMVGVVATALAGCGSSTQEEQIAWLNSWNSFDKHEEKLKMLSVCFKEAGVKSMTQQISKQQNEVVNECELSYISEMADKDGISLDRQTLKNNITQF